MGSQSVDARHGDVGHIKTRRSNDGQVPSPAMDVNVQHVIEALPEAIYLTDASGRITFYNQRAAELWGREPQLGVDDQRFCGSLQLWQMDGSPLPHD